MADTTRKPKQKPKPPFPEQHQEKPGLESRMEPRPHYHGSQYKPAQKLKDQVALFTGGDSGIGRSAAVLFAREGGRTWMKRAAQPEEIAPAYVFFASEADSSYITGEVLPLLGSEATAG